MAAEQDETHRSEPPMRQMRDLANSAIASGRPLSWYETLYKSAAAGSATVPWDHCEADTDSRRLADRTVPRREKQRQQLAAANHTGHRASTSRTQLGYPPELGVSDDRSRRADRPCR